MQHYVHNKIQLKKSNSNKKNPSLVQNFKYALNYQNLKLRSRTFSCRLIINSWGDGEPQKENRKGFERSLEGSFFTRPINVRHPLVCSNTERHL